MRLDFPCGGLLVFCLIIGIVPARGKETKIEKNAKNEGISKKFIGRIEHGKVKVLRRKEDKFDIDEGSCTKSFNNCPDEEDFYDSSEEQNKSKRKQKVRYSIKFRHEKQRGKTDNGDISIKRLHKNRRDKYGREVDDDFNEEEDKPIKRFHFAMDEDD